MKADWDTPEINEQIEAVIRRLSLAEKIELVSGNLVIEKPGEETKLPEGIPLFVLADGPAGIRILGEKGKPGKSTNLPAPIALAATWDPELVRQYGDLIGREMVATGHNILLGPAVDIARAPLGGRTFESFGEDPLLQARMVAAEIPAIQAHGVQACIKHYLVNNQEYQRTSVDVQVDERTLQEIYLPPFAAAVQQGQVALAMGSYNKINGTYACENASVLTTILREQLGFRGWVMSDFMATPSTAAAANAGLEWELGDERWGEKLLAAVQAGEVTETRLDEMVRRILRPTYGLGLHKRQREIRPFPINEHGAKARTIAEQSIVLLKNEGDLLPLSVNTVRSIAIIGPDADNISAAGGGSAAVQATYGVSVLAGIRQRVGDEVKVGYAPGVDPIGAGILLPGLPAVPSDYFSPPEGSEGIHGVRAEYWANLDFAGEPNLIRNEPCIELNQGFFDIMSGVSVASPKLPPAPMNAGVNGRLAARWTGSLTAPTSGEYTLSLTVQGTARLYLGDRLVIDTAVAQPVASSNSRVLPNTAPDEWDAYALKVYTAVTRLTANQPMAVKVEYAADAQEVWPIPQAMLRFGWQPPADVVTPMMETAVTLAQQSDVAIIVVRTFESEEMDRPDLCLPNRQDKLIQAVTAVNPHTVVVIMSGAAVETASWEDNVPAVIEAWYTGQEQGNAVARILFGDVNPSGKLPLTFPRTEQETPVATQAQYPGVDGVVHYSEGLAVGYRGYEQKGIEPRYPFGHGLSYTTFAYGPLSVTPETTDGKQPIQVSFELTNIGFHAGTEIAQVYLQLPDATAAPRKLVGWTRVSLAPGKRRRVTIELDPLSWERPFSYWNTQNRQWEIAPGTYQLSVGASSQDIRLSSSFPLIAGA
ncbi:MAG: glycoside hydrolase family 3 C-terminal domain-containing protein [Ardenticatenaceae bacterium]|nr:glycoside hydrolase family 3 C-terminal domain-containing protein [Ardenticatenaceae bacterium]